jgi:hypothetical protein
MLLLGDFSQRARLRDWQIPFQCALSKPPVELVDWLEKPKLGC